MPFAGLMSRSVGSSQLAMVWETSLTAAGSERVKQAVADLGSAVFPGRKIKFDVEFALCADDHVG